MTRYTYDSLVDEFEQGGGDLEGSSIIVELSRIAAGYPANADIEVDDYEHGIRAVEHLINAGMIRRDDYTCPATGTVRRQS